MIDLKQLRENPARFRDGAAKKGIEVQFDQILRLDEEHRAALTRREGFRAEQKKIEKDIGPQIGQIKATLGKSKDGSRPALEAQLKELLDKPAALKQQIDELDAVLARIEPDLKRHLLAVPLPPDADVPVGQSADDNVAIKHWNPPSFDAAKPFEAQRGFKPNPTSNSSTSSALPTSPAA